MIPKLTKQHCDLVLAVQLVTEKWEWLRQGSREPIAIKLRRPENELLIMEMIVAMNHLYSVYEKCMADSVNTKT